MATGLRQELRQKQSLVMTQQLQQAIKLLQLSSLELSRFLETQVEQNPLLDWAPDDSPAPSLNEDSSEAPALTTVDRALESGAGPDYEPSEDGPVAGSGASTGEQIGAGLSLSQPAGEAANQPDIFGRIEIEESLAEHLHAQVNVNVPDDGDRLIAHYLVDCVDDSGYLAEPLDEIAARLSAKPEELEDVLKQLQQCEPTGVMARDLAECLRLQLQEQGAMTPSFERLLTHLDLIAVGGLERLRKLCGVDQSGLQKMLAHLRTLDPKPGLQFGGGVVELAVPDVRVTQRSDGAWAVELNQEALPKVLIDQHYYAEVSAAAAQPQDKSYLAECFSNANWLVRALDQRAKTILKVASEIVRQQESFLNEGVSKLKPLNLRIIAEAISMHESTVSRVTAGKYMQTPRGIFDMKFFFTSSVPGGADGEQIAAEAVKARIRALIDAEDARRPLSDDKLVDLLRDEDIQIARRTVAKYREALNLGSSVERRREKALRA